MEPEFSTVELGEVRIHYAEAPGPGPALVLLHGVLGSHLSFLPLLPDLAAGAHVYALDLRGHGWSSHVPGKNHVADYARDVAAFIATVVGRPAIIAAHSLGGLVAIRVAAEAPERVSGVLLEDVPFFEARVPRFYESAFYGIFRVVKPLLLEHASRGGTVDELVAALEQWPAGDGRTLLEAQGEAVVRRQAAEMHQFAPDALDPAMDGTILDRFDTDEAPRLIRCPVHLVAGQRDLGGAMTEQDVRDLVAQIPNCTFTVVEGVGHGIHIHRPRVFIDELQAFVSTRVQGVARAS